MSTTNAPSWSGPPVQSVNCSTLTGKARLERFAAFSIWIAISMFLMGCAANQTSPAALGGTQTGQHPMNPARGNASAGSSVGEWQVAEETVINGTVEQIKMGTVFKTISGSVYQVSEPVFLVEVEVVPKVLVLSDGVFFKLIIENVEQPLMCRRIAGPPLVVRRMPPANASPSVIETRIDGDFEGFDSDKVFTMQNGQVWQQTGFRYHYTYRYSPAVRIWRSGATYRMKVDGLDDDVAVTRLR